MKFSATPSAPSPSTAPRRSLTKTAHCQPALYVHGLACLAMLKEKRPDLAFHAGRRVVAR
ncbi:MAG: hypothetical protein QM796_06320 [Chthoniobacteraceae bacterium]